VVYHYYARLQSSHLCGGGGGPASLTSSTLPDSKPVASSAVAVFEWPSSSFIATAAPAKAVAPIVSARERAGNNARKMSMGLDGRLGRIERRRALREKSKVWWAPLKHQAISHSLHSYLIGHAAFGGSF
jgi:hypothetical protein